MLIGAATLPAGQLEAAVAGARASQPAWAALPFGDRLATLQRACDAAMASLDLDATSALLTREHGKVLVESLFDLATSAGMVGALSPLVATSLEPRPEGNAVVERVPQAQVVAAILPFNWPAAVMGNKILPALLAGNTVVVKTPPTCPGAVLLLAGAIADGLPPGVLNTVNGQSPELGVALVDHPGIDMVSFTGGITAGRSVLAGLRPPSAAGRPSSGGNDTAIVAPDLEPSADLADRLLEAAFTTSGQVCMAMNASTSRPSACRFRGSASGRGAVPHRGRRRSFRARGDHGTGAHRGLPTTGSRR